MPWYKLWEMQSYLGERGKLYFVKKVKLFTFTLHMQKDNPWANWYKQLTKVKGILFNIPKGAISSDLFLHLLQSALVLA